MDPSWGVSHLGVLEIEMAKVLHQFDSQLALHVGRPSTFHRSVEPRQNVGKDHFGATSHDSAVEFSGVFSVFLIGICEGFQDFY